MSFSFNISVVALSKKSGSSGLSRLSIVGHESYQNARQETGTVGEPFNLCASYVESVLGKLSSGETVRVEFPFPKNPDDHLAIVYARLGEDREFYISFCDLERGDQKISDIAGKTLEICIGTSPNKSIVEGETDLCKILTPRARSADAILR